MVSHPLKHDKNVMRVHYVMSFSNEQKLIGIEIKKCKKSKDSVLRTGMTFIYGNGKEICIIFSHPNFVMVKAEETTTLLNQESSIVLIELTDEQYTKH